MPRPTSLLLVLSMLFLAAPLLVTRVASYPLYNLPLVEDVGEAVPLRDALERHDDPVVGPAVALHLLHLGGRSGRVAAVAEHGVDGIEARPRAALRTIPIEGNAESEDLTRGGEPTRRRDALGRDVVQRAQLVVE